MSKKLSKAERKAQAAEARKVLDEQFSKIEHQVGNVIMMHTAYIMAANACCEKSAAMVAPYGKYFTQEAKQAYTHIQEMTHKLSLEYEKILNDTMAAIETDGDNSECDKYDAVHEMANIMLIFGEVAWRARNVSKETARKILEYAEGLCKDEFLDEKAKNGLIRYSVLDEK